MTKNQLKQAIISVLIGALTACLVNILQGLLDVVNHWIVNGAGGVTAAGSYLVKTFKA